MTSCQTTSALYLTALVRLFTNHLLMCYITLGVSGMHKCNGLPRYKEEAKVSSFQQKTKSIFKRLEKGFIYLDENISEKQLTKVVI